MDDACSYVWDQMNCVMNIKISSNVIDNVVLYCCFTKPSFFCIGVPYSCGIKKETNSLRKCLMEKFLLMETTERYADNFSQGNFALSL